MMWRSVFLARQSTVILLAVLRLATSGLKLVGVDPAIIEKEYHSKDRLWASWGDYDRWQFERACKEAGVPYPFGTSRLNVKSLFSLASFT